MHEGTSLKSHTRNHQVDFITKTGAFIFRGRSKREMPDLPPQTLAIYGPLFQTKHEVKFFSLILNETLTYL